MTDCVECAKERETFGPKAECVTCFFKSHVTITTIGR